MVFSWLGVKLEVGFEGSSDRDFAARLYIFIFVCVEYFQPEIVRNKDIKPGPEKHFYEKEPVLVKFTSCI